MREGKTVKDVMLPGEGVIITKSFAGDHLIRNETTSALYVQVTVEIIQKIDRAEFASDKSYDNAISFYLGLLSFGTNIPTFK